MPKVTRTTRPDRFAAFISYTRADEMFARTLHRRLESYFVPKSARDGLPLARSKMFRPIFRDQDEFAASSDLGASIRHALNRSDALIVISSSNASRSQWVHEEIAHFIAHRPGHPVVVVQLKEPGLPPGPALEALGPADGVSYIQLGGPGPTTAELTKIVALALGRDPFVFSKNRASEIRRRWSRRIGLVTTTVTAVVIVAVVALPVIFFSLLFVPFSRGQDSYVIGTACGQLQENFVRADSLLALGNDGWFTAASEARVALTKMYDVCRSVKASRPAEPKWVLRP
jgi:MTH538 TIR-like domain (DUF1863)